MGISPLEIFNLYVDRLFCIRGDLYKLYTEEEEALGEGICSLETWIQFAAEAPDINDAVVTDALSPAIY